MVMPCSSTLTFAQSVGSAVTSLLHPHAEVVFHDLATGRIAGMWNGFSGRRIGDASLLDAAADADLGSVLGPYAKTSLSGGTIRSISVVVPGPAGDDPPAGLLCINLDVSLLDQAQHLLASFVAPLNQRPAALFVGDWREALNDSVHGWLQERGLSIAALTRTERIDLVAALDVASLFNTRHSAEHAAKLIGVSRATIYVYLNEARNGRTDRGSFAA